MVTTLKTPYQDLLPPLSTEEFAALKADIKANGVLSDVLHDEDGNVLDGHNRLKIDPSAPTQVIKGLSEGEKEAFVFRCNNARRNLSQSQQTEVRRKMQATAKRLREENPKHWTQKRVSEVLGVGQQTVSDWFQAGTNTGSGNTSKPKPDARTKVPPQRKPEIAERIAAGENREQVAADFGITGRQAATIATAETKMADKKRERQEAATTIKGNCGVIHGDFRVGGAVLSTTFYQNP